MGSIKDFMAAIGLLREKFEYESDFMTNTGNWCFVHATKYLPRNKSDGTAYIPTTGMATDFQFPRTTVHATLNHIVTSHGYGSWDDAPIVVLAPYNDIVEKNGNPVEVAGTDTYWSLHPDKGLILPESAYVIKPDDNGPLFQIGEHGATYKRGNYTPKQIEQIEELIDNPYDLEEYTRYKTGDLEKWEIERAINSDERIRQGYERAKQKGTEKDFWRGLFEESRFNILSKYLRDAVVKMSMKQIGKDWINGISDASKTSEIIANTAEANGIPGNASNKGHLASIYGGIDSFADSIEQTLEFDVFGVSGIFKTDIKSLYDVIVEKGWRENPLVFAIILNLIENQPIDFLKLYQDEYKFERDGKISTEKINLDNEQDLLDKYDSNYFDQLDEDSKNRQMQLCRDRIIEHTSYIQKMSTKPTIADYDENLWESVRRHCERLASKYQAWRSELIKNPEYKNLVQKLRVLIGKTGNIMQQGREM